MNRNQRLSVIRGWLHDLMCMSGCEPSDGDHARRTQHAAAVRLEAAAASSGGGDLARAIHDQLCLAWLRSARPTALRECRHTAGELDWVAYENAAAGLEQRLSGA